MRITKKELREELGTLGRAIRRYTGMAEPELIAEHRKIFPEAIVPPTEKEIINSILQANLHYAELRFQLI